MTSAPPKIVAPPFDNGLCRLDPEYWDYEFAGETKSERAQRIEDAAEACHRCPVYRECKAWLAGLPANQRPSGVVAGHLLAPRWTVTRSAQQTRARARINARPPNRMAGADAPADASQSRTAAHSGSLDRIGV